MIKISVKINGQDVSAILNTAAEVSISFRSIFQTINIKLKIVKKVVMHAAGRNMQMAGTKLDSVRLKIGSQEYLEPLYVAPIENYMLLG